MQRSAVLILVVTLMLRSTTSSAETFRESVGAGFKYAGLAVFVYGLYGAAYTEFERRNHLDEKKSDCVAADQECRDEKYRSSMRTAGAVSLAGVGLYYIGVGIGGKSGSGRSAEVRPEDAGETLSVGLSFNPSTHVTGMVLTQNF